MRIVQETVENIEINGYCASMVLLDDACSLLVSMKLAHVIATIYTEKLGVDATRLKLYKFDFPVGLILYDGDRVFFELYAYDRELKTLYVYVIELTPSDVEKLARGTPP
jgi:hypothetical protein